jgi:iron complex outermembrane receptor protein
MNLIFKPRLTFLFLILFYWTTSQATLESGLVAFSGKVIDAATNNPLPGATIFIAELNRGDVADKDGEFQLKEITKGNYTVVCRFVGYTDVKETIPITGNLEKKFYMTPTVIEFSEVTVTAKKEEVELTRSSQSVAVLSAEKLEKHRGQTFSETLKEIPGVTVLQTGPSISKPVVRGLHSQRVLVLNAGLAQEGQQWGAEHAPEIDPFAPAKIEVLKGAAGVEFGSSAIGGVVRVEPRALSAIQGLGGQVIANGFSNSSQGSGSLLVEGRAPGISRLNWRLQGSLRKAGDARAPDYVIGNSGFEERDWSFAAGYLREHSSIELYYSHFGTELGIYRGSHIGNTTDLLRAIERGRPLVDYDFSYDIRPPKQKISHDLLAVKGQLDFESAGKIEWQYGFQLNHRQEFDSHTLASIEPPKNAAFDLKLYTHSGDLKFRHRPFKNFFGTVGVSAMWQGNFRQSSGFLIPNFRASTLGVFVLENWTKGGFTLNFGGRFDNRRQRAYFFRQNPDDEQIDRWHNVSGVIGMIYQFAPAWSLGVNAGTAWRPPSVNEQFSDGVHHGTAQHEKGDPNLQSEKSYNIDATLRNVGQKSQLELSVYNNFINDFIFLFPEPEPILTIRGAFPAFSYRQSNSVLRGIDLTFDYQLFAFYRFGTRASVVRGDNLDTDEPLIFMPSDRLQWINHFDLPAFASLENPYFEISATFVRRQDRVPANSDFTDPPPGYKLIDVELGTQIKWGRHPILINLSANNIFNTAYRDYLSRFRYFIDDPGRNVVLRMQVPFGKFKTMNEMD